MLFTLNNAALLVWAAIFCFHKPSKVKNLLFVILSFTQLFVIMAFRYNVGFDYQMYAMGFRNMQDTGFETLAYKDWETGFILVTKLIGMIPSIDYDWYMLILSLIAIVPAAIFIYKNSPVPWISVILYVNMFMFFMSMNFLRQMIAVSLLMLAWHFMKRNKFWLYLLVIIIASFFHQTVLIMLPVYLLVKVKPGMKELLLYGYLLLWFYLASTNIIQVITSFYHEEYSDSIFIKEGVSIVYALVPLFITIVSFLLVKTGTINLTNENKYLINLSFIGTVLMVTMSKHSIIERLSYYFIIFMILLVPVIYQSLKNNGIKYTTANNRVIDFSDSRSCKALSLSFLVLVLLISYAVFYYGMFENAHGIVEYQFRFVHF